MKKGDSRPEKKFPGKIKSDLYIYSERSNPDRLAAIRKRKYLRALFTELPAAKLGNSWTLPFFFNTVFIMETNIQIFENGNLGMVRVIDVNGEPMFVGSDAATLLGYTNPQKAIRDHVDEEDKLTERIVLSGQAREVVVINESGFYSLVLSSKLPTAKAAKRWVTSEVLPAIRKTGGYMITKAEDTPEEIMARALLVAQDTMKRKEARIHQLKETAAIQDQQIKVAAPKVEYHDTVLMSTDTYTTNQIAKELGISAVTLNKKLKAHGIQYSQSGQWLLYAKYQSKGFTKTHTYTFTHATTGQPGTTMRTVWTEAGRKFIHGLLKIPESIDK